MVNRTTISWADVTWNPVTGCSRISAGCEHCYAERLSIRFGWSTKPWTSRNASENVIVHEGRLTAPLHIKKSQRIFVCSMSDLFHDQVPDQFIGKVFGAMTEAWWHTFLVLTKRAERLAEWSRSVCYYPNGDRSKRPMPGWPPNAWVGISAEDQRTLDVRLPQLQSVRASVQFLSLEPLLGPIQIPDTWLYYKGTQPWVIVAGESGGPQDRALVQRVCRCGDFKESHDPGCFCGCKRWRPEGYDTDGIKLGWVTDIRDQCVKSGVPFYFKGFGGLRQDAGGRLLGGQEWLERPNVEVRR